MNQGRSPHVVHVVLVTLVFGFGCSRFGYEPRRMPEPPGRDAGSAGPRDPDDAHTQDADEPEEASIADATVNEAGSIPNEDAAVDPADAGRDAASPAMDAGPGEQDGGTVSTRCPSIPGAVICDDFEDATLAPWDYTVIVNGAVEQTTTRAYRGTGSLLATTGSPGPMNRARYASRAFESLISGDIWLRYYYYIPSTTVVNAVFSTAVISELTPPYFGFSLVITPAQVDIGVLGTRYEGAVAFPRDRWTCVELHVAIDDTNGVFEAFLDGDRVATSPETDTLPDTGYTNVEVGIHFTDPTQGPVEAFADDVVVAHTRMGCN